MTADTLKQLLFPSGEIHFQGTWEQFLAALHKAGGVMAAEGKFRCTLPPPKRQGIRFSLVRTRNWGMVLFQFVGKCEPITGGFRIHYQVMPTFFTWSLPVLLLAMAIESCRQSAGTKVGLYPLWIISMVIPPVLLYFLWERTALIAQFLEIFKS